MKLSELQEESTVYVASNITKVVDHNYKNTLKEFEALISNCRGDNKKRLMSAFELGKRFALVRQEKNVQVLEAKTAYEYILPYLFNSDIEKFYVIYVNHSNRILGHKLIGTGGLTSVQTDARLILKYALECNATGFILCHNHPSQNRQPSSADRKMTRHISECAKILNIRTLDHLVVTDTEFYSFGENSEDSLF